MTQKKYSEIIFIWGVFVAIMLHISIQSSAQDIPQQNLDSIIAQKIFDNKKNKILNNIVFSALERYHFKPAKVNDSLSAHVFSEYIKDIDRFKMFLLQEDIEYLSKYQLELDEQLASDRLDFFNLSVNLLEKRTKEAQNYYKDILAKPFDFNIKEEIEQDPEKQTYAKTNKELKERWRTHLKTQCLRDVWNALDKQKKAHAKNDTVKLLPLAEIEQTKREKLLKRQNDWFHRILDQVNNTDRISLYINSLTAAFDPHSSYFPPKLKDDFDIAFSGKLEGIGATLSPKDGYIRIVELVPGSPSWKTKKLAKDDLIMKVAQGDEEPVDVYDMRLDDAVKMIRGPKGTEVRLTIKKPDESIIVVPIIRDVVVREETYAKSCVLETKVDGKKVRAGYIYLPSFYTDFRSTKGRSCETDMAKEIEKVKADGINNIILDLRSNGGGSLGGAVDIAGLFIDKGPVVQRKNGLGQTKVLNDTDPKVQFDGNLVILVSETSASASEILAAAMQDYKRAVIVGPISTYGKGTVQQFVDIDRLLPAKFNEYKSFGSIKITMEKFYRINGGATQLKGVTPDIVLPTSYTLIDFGEKERDYPLQWDEIASTKYTPKQKYIPNMALIQSKSKARIEHDTTFQKIKEYAKWIKKERDNSIIPLDMERFTIKEETRKKQQKRFDNIGKDSLDIATYDLSKDAPIINADSVKRDDRNDWYKNICKDIYIKEALEISHDLQAVRKEE